MRPRRIALLLMPACAVLLSCASSFGQESRNVGERCYIAVMGAVSLPGVYEYASADRPVAAVIRDGGGLTEEAAGTFRIVRSGQFSRQAFYTGENSERLHSGDVLIVERSSLDGAGRSESGRFVHLTVMNLLHRPVVLLVTPENATLGRLLRLLNQPEEIVSSVKIAAKEARLFRKSRASAEQIRNESHLTSGTVVTFDPARVEMDRVPLLPATYKPRETLVTETASSPPDWQPQQANSTDATGDELSQIQLAGFHQGVPAEATEAGIGGPWRSAFDVDGDPKTLEQLPPPDLEQIEAPDPPIVAEVFQPTRTSVKPPAETSKQTEPAAAEKPQVVASNGKALVRGAIFAVLGLLVAGGWYLQRRLQHPARPVTAAAAATRQPVAAAENLLDVLIENRLPLEEESCPLPEVLHLFGAPTTEKQLRRDAGHALAGPHFRTRPTGARVEAPAAVPAASTDRKHAGDEQERKRLLEVEIPPTEQYMAATDSLLMSRTTTEDAVNTDSAPAGDGRRFRFDTKHEPTLSREQSTATGSGSGDVLGRVLVSLRGSGRRR